MRTRFIHIEVPKGARLIKTLRLECAESKIIAQGFCGDSIAIGSQNVAKILKPRIFVLAKSVKFARASAKLCQVIGPQQCCVKFANSSPKEYLFISTSIAKAAKVSVRTPAFASNRQNSFDNGKQLQPIMLVGGDSFFGRFLPPRDLLYSWLAWDHPASGSWRSTVRPKDTVRLICPTDLAADATRSTNRGYALRVSMGRKQLRRRLRPVSSQPVAPVLRATARGPKTCHEEAHFAMDAYYVTALNLYIQENFGGQLIGDWHSHHDLGMNHASGGDVNHIHRLAGRNNLQTMVQLVLTRQKVTVPTFQVRQGSSNLDMSMFLRLTSSRTLHKWFGELPRTFQHAVGHLWLHASVMEDFQLSRLKSSLHRSDFPWGPIPLRVSCIENLNWFERLSFEDKLVKKCFPSFNFVYDSKFGKTCFSNWIVGNERINNYKLRLELSCYFPDRQPNLFIEYPMILWTFGGCVTINNVGVSCDYHVYDLGSDGSVRIFFVYDWDASCTCVMVLTRGVIWIEGYEHHLRTSETIANFIENVSWLSPGRKRQLIFAKLSKITNFYTIKSDIFNGVRQYSYITAPRTITCAMRFQKTPHYSSMRFCQRPTNSFFNNLYFCDWEKRVNV